MTTHDADPLGRDRLVRRLERAGEILVLGEHLDEIEEYFDPARFAFHGPDGFDADYGGLLAYFGALRDAFDDRSIRRDDVVVEGTRIACRTLIEGTFARAFTMSPVGELPPHGRRVVWDLVNIFTVDDHGRLIRELARVDNRGVLRQLGQDGAEGTLQRTQMCQDAPA